MKKRVHGCGGVISIDRKGSVGIAHTTPHMSWAKISSDQVMGEEVFVEYGLRMDDITRRKMMI